MKATIAPKKSLGQNFLHNTHFSEKIVQELNLQSGDHVLEIGPGTGALTQWISKRTDIDYIGVELDHRAIPELTKQFPQFKFLEADILTVSLSTLVNQGKSLVVVGNIPYYITSPILFHLLDQKQFVKQIVLMVQHEVAQRITATPGGKEYGILSVQFQQAATCDYLFKVPPEAFFPPPTVDSAVIRLTFSDEPPFPVRHPELFKKVVRTVFGMRRKTLKNNLKSLIGNKSVTCVDSSRRAETLNIAEFVQLTEEIHKLNQSP